MSATLKIDRAKTRILLDHPFFASILLRKPMVKTPHVPTLAVDSAGTVFYNEEFINRWSVDQVVWALCHEIGHVMAMHAIRRGHRDPKLWNYAGDAWINDMLKQCKIGEPIPNCVDIAGSYQKFTEQIYQEMSQRPPGGGGGGGQGNDPMDGDGIGSDIIEGKNDPNSGESKHMSEAEMRAAEAEMKVTLAQAAQAAKMKGNLPGVLAEFVADVLASHVPWYEKLEKYASDKVKAKWDWTKANRRYVSQGVILPSRSTKPTIGTVVIQTDVSGSVSKREIDHFNGHFVRIMEECNPKKVHIIYTDTRVQKHVEVEQGGEARIEFYSGGGTDMTAGFDYIKEQGIEPDVFITLTDGYTPFPENPPFDAVWCVSTDAEVPDSAGEVIRFKIEDN